MVLGAEASLRRALAELQAGRAKIDKEIEVIKKALAALGVSSPNLAGRRLRKPMSAAEKKAVSKRMKTYWASRRKASASQKGS